jgi:hypothetical protein
MKKHIMAVVLAALCGFASCTSLLDTKPYHQVATQNMWTTENLTDMGIAGIYSNLRNTGTYGTAVNSTGVGQWGFDIYGVTGQCHLTAEFLNGNLSPGSGNVLNVWKKMYEGVHRANDAIANIPLKSPVTDEKKARLTAEARFLRAFYYYRLNELFRGVPYYDRPIKVEECINPQETEDFIWGKIIDDLTLCIGEPNFPNNNFTEARATKGAAYALRGKAYMQQGKWAEAVADFDKVGECGYSLFQGGYKQLFTEANERSPEMIFSVGNFGEPGYGSISQKYLGSRSAHSTVGTNGWGDHHVTPYAVDLHENADGTDFNWDDIIQGYNAMTVADREVFFLRDTLDAGGRPKDASIRAKVRDRLKSTDISAAAKARYLPYGNETRLRRAYANRDPRLETNVITPYAKFYGYIGSAAANVTMRWPYVNTNAAIDDFMPDGGKQSLLLYYYRKFVYEGYNPVHREACPTDDPMIRYADVLLMQAEALIELDRLTDAEAKVNEVRGRASVNMPPVSFTGKDAAREKVRKERRIELLGEGISYFDELRWGTLKQTKYAPGLMHKQAWGADGQGAAYRWPDRYSGEKFVWPAPQDEIQKNPNLKPTPGWVY